MKRKLPLSSRLHCCNEDWYLALIREDDNKQSSANWRNHRRWQRPCAVPATTCDPMNHGQCQQSCPPVWGRAKIRWGNWIWVVADLISLYSWETFTHVEYAWWTRGWWTARWTGTVNRRDEHDASNHTQSQEPRAAPATTCDSMDHRLTNKVSILFSFQIQSSSHNHVYDK